MKRISIVVAAVVLISSIFFIAASPSPSVLMKDNYVKAGGIVKYNDFGNHFSNWNGVANGGLVYLKLNGTTVGQSAIGSDGSFYIVSSVVDDQDYDLLLTTSTLAMGSDTWQGSTAYHHVEGVIESLYIYAGLM